MSIRTWLYVFTIGLVVCGSTQAQEEGQSGTDDSTNQHQETQSTEPSFAIPITIVESNESASTRENSEGQSAEREKRDLIAQERMADATEAMNIATHSMKDAAWWSFGVVSLGTVLLVWTLRLTRQATKAARDGVKVTRNMMQDQLRAFIAVDAGKNRSPCEFTYDERGITASLTFVNKGQTPARKMTFLGTLSIRIDEEVIGWAPVIDVHGGMAPNGDACISWTCDRFNRARLNNSEKAKISVQGVFHYITFYEKLARTGFSAFTDMQYGNMNENYTYSTKGNELN